MVSIHYITYHSAFVLILCVFLFYVVQTHFFHKPKNLGWWLVLGVPDGELLALKRIAISGTKIQTKLSFAAPLELGEVNLILWLVSDAIRGLDQQHTIPLIVIRDTTDDAAITGITGSSSM